METDCSHDKSIWIFPPRYPLKIYALEGTKSVSNEGMDDSSKCAMVSNEFNTWQIMQMALKMSSFLASLCPIQLNKTCIKNKSIFFCLTCTRVLNLSYGSVSALRESNFISLFLSFCSTKRWVLWVSGEVLFSTLPLVHGQFHLLSPNLQCGYIIQT